MGIVDVRAGVRDGGAVEVGHDDAGAVREREDFVVSRIHKADAGRDGLLSVILFFHFASFSIPVIFSPVMSGRPFHHDAKSKMLSC